MYKLSDSTGPSSIVKAFNESYDFNGYDGKDKKYELIKKAKSVSITDILSSYDIHLYESNKIRCPFTFHSNGMERTPSFYIYPNTNTFYCFGCGSGTTTIDLVSLLDSISKDDAISKILENYCGEEYKNIVNVNNEFSKDKVDLYLQFSSIIYEFNKLYDFDENALKYSEKLCKVFDDLNAKHNMDEKALNSLIYKLKKYLNSYK